MNCREYGRSIEKAIKPLGEQIARYHSFASLGHAIEDAWKEVGFGIKDLSFTEAIVSSSPKRSSYVSVSDPQLEPLSKEDAEDLVSIVKERYSEYSASMGTALSYARPTAGELKISIDFTNRFEAKASRV